MDVASAEQPQLVILDLGLPDADGLNVLQRFADLPQLEHVPVVVLSGRSCILWRGNTER